jgi:hypothetical protein
MGKFRHSITGFAVRQHWLLPSLGLLSVTTIACRSVPTPPIAAQPSPSPSVVAAPKTIPPSAPVPNATVQQELAGEWRDESLIHNQQVPSLWFAENGKAYIISDINGQKMATQVNYRLNTATQPMQIDIAPGTDAPMLGIFEFSADGKLRIDGGEVRPARFSDHATLHQKVSAQPQLPSNIEIMGQAPDPAAQAQTASIQGRAMLKAMNRNQQVLYQVNQQFASTLAELGFEIPGESDHYIYTIVTKGDRQVVMSAQARQPQFKSYTSVLIARNPQQVAVVLCETAQPKAPVIDGAMLKGTIAAPERFRCPAGSVPVP